MKRPFVVLNLNQKSAQTKLTVANHECLLDLARKHNLPKFDQTLIESHPVPGSTLASKLDEFDPATIFLVGGRPTPAMLAEVMEQLYKRDFDAIIVFDALDNRAELHQALLKLNELPTQISRIAEVGLLVKSKRMMLYKYPKADVTAGCFVFLDWYTKNPLVLTIERLHEPFAGHESGPGGFLNILLETVPHCAGREQFEETGLTLDHIELLDVRSDPQRDVRGHVVDHGYGCFVPKRLRNKVFNSVKAGDDAKPGSARFVALNDLLKRSLAFDHDDMLAAGVKRLKELRRAYLRRSRAARLGHHRRKTATPKRRAGSKAPK